MNMRLWETTNEETYLIEEKEIVSKRYVGDTSLTITGLPDNLDLSELEKEVQAVAAQKELSFYEDYQEDLQTILDELGYKTVVHWANDYYSIEDNDFYLYDTDDNTFSHITEMEVVEIYEWYDGNNMKEIISHDVELDYKLEITKDFVNLDEWYGAGWRTGTNYNHEKIYRIISMDGEEQKDSYLLKTWSNFQNMHEYGRIVDLVAIESRLEELDYNIDEYMRKVELL